MKHMFDNIMTMKYCLFKALLMESIRLCEDENEGLLFEKELYERLENAKNDKQVKAILKKIGLEEEQIENHAYRVEHVGGGNRRRRIINPDGTINTPLDTGSTIADIRVVFDSNGQNRVENISVKYGDNLKITNLGIRSFFKNVDMQNIADHPCSIFFDTLFTDGTDIARNFIEYFTTNEALLKDKYKNHYEACCAKEPSSFRSLDDFIQYIREVVNTNDLSVIQRYNKQFEPFLYDLSQTWRNAIDSNSTDERLVGKYSMVAMWLANFDLKAYKKAYGTPPGFQRNAIKFGTKLNSQNYPEIVGVDSDDEVKAQIEGTHESALKFLEDSNGHELKIPAFKSFLKSCIGSNYWNVHGHANGTIEMCKIDDDTCASIVRNIDMQNPTFRHYGRHMNLYFSESDSLIKNFMIEFRNNRSGLLPNAMQLSYDGFKNIKGLETF